MAAVTEREYGDRVGIWRLLELFDRYDLKVTFLMNGLKVEQFADARREIKSQGHEFSSEGYEHEYSFMYTLEEERESIRKTIGAFEKVLGQKPTGYLSPGHASTDNTLELVADAGFIWWADPLNSDNPYTLEVRGRKVIVVPYNVPGCNDYSTYGTGRTPRDLLQIMKDHFDYLYWEGEQGGAETFRLQPSSLRLRRPLPDKNHRRVHPLRAGIFQSLVRPAHRDRELVAGKKILNSVSPSPKIYAAGDALQ